MSKVRLKTALLFFVWTGVLLSAVQNLAQRRCGTTEYMQRLRNANHVLESETQFEEWLEKQQSDKPVLRVQSTNYKIQVVVHVIHNGEPIGNGKNISDAQIISQINVLNKDFNRQNTDATSTPPEFQDLAGSMGITFELAQLAPDGSASSGITRTKGTKASWTINDNTELKSLSYWPAENYLNIWVCNITDFLGFTQFPISTLPGLENSSENRLTDGVIVRYDCFGSLADGSFNLDPAYNKGRTATHEVGHFFGLRHIWGDVTGCGGTDYVDDTPPQNGPTSGCPTHPQKECPTGNPVAKMFQNFVDYSDDACMNLFTQGQVNRMKVVLENCPRRYSLLLATNSIDGGTSFQKIFSPNGDGINDFWKWSNAQDYQGCKLSIYNRFGKKVFEMISYDNSWDGRSSDGEVLQAEAYYFIIHCDGKNDVTGGVRIVK